MTFLEMSNLLKTATCRAISCRFVSKKCYNWPDEGIQYYGFKYYPRFKDFQDQPYTPTKLFRVQLIQNLKGVPHYERKILQHLNLEGQRNHVAILKNIPETNQKLWKIKHLVKIDPITFPDGFPQDTNGTFLKENGELKVRQILEPYEEKLQLTEKFNESPKKMDTETLRKNLRMKWMQGW